MSCFVKQYQEQTDLFPRKEEITETVLQNITPARLQVNPDVIQNHGGTKLKLQTKQHLKKEQQKNRHHIYDQ